MFLNKYFLTLKMENINVNLNKKKLYELLNIKNENIKNNTIKLNESILFNKLKNLSINQIVNSNNQNLLHLLSSIKLINLIKFEKKDITNINKLELYLKKIKLFITNLRKYLNNARKFNEALNEQKEESNKVKKKINLIFSKNDTKEDKYTKIINFYEQIIDGNGKIIISKIGNKTSLIFISNELNNFPFRIKENTNIFKARSYLMKIKNALKSKLPFKI